eukprot:CAMPEP_0172173094 /NCGR_PEP_ID=MMETSP1050-20130122/12836_1 /TAXON_ID=233186 /ORGANISM="Cryptomonas curvata, Strain CCAP979/52" /LENGTH=82 /DNA_ID=CAMNT_0012844757 /DNA_START=480 /DNA_END=725 /DNA_ORIENTATION=+
MRDEKTPAARLMWQVGFVSTGDAVLCGPARKGQRLLTAAACGTGAVSAPAAGPAAGFPAPSPHGPSLRTIAELGDAAGLQHR